MFHGYPDAVDADLSDYFGSVPHVELHQTHDRKDTCVDGYLDDVARYHGNGEEVEPHVARLGELLSGW